MRRLTGILTLFLSLAFAGGAIAANLQPGKDYDLVSPPQPTDAKGKIEVLEFFSYACPHCAHFEPVLEAWVKRLPKDVAFRRVPVTFQRPQWGALARGYYAIEAMNEVDRLQGPMFTAVHVDRNINVATAQSVEASMADWIAGKGIDRKKFEDNFNSFSVQSLATRAERMTGSYGIQGVPMLVVAGKYRTPDNYPGGPEEMLKLVDAIIAKARAEK